VKPVPQMRDWYGGGWEIVRKEGEGKRGEGWGERWTQSIQCDHKMDLKKHWKHV